MRDFDWDEFQKGEIVVNCRTVKHAQNFISAYFSRILDYTNDIKKFIDLWYIFEEKTCYVIRRGEVGVNNMSNSSVVKWQPEKLNVICDEQEIDWNNILKFTKVQVRDDEYDIWLNRYFVGYNKGSKYPYKTTSLKKGDEFSGLDPLDSGCYAEFKYCRLYKEEE